MKNIVKRLARDEKGAALVLVLVLLLMGGLIIAPLLAHMGTGLITGEVYERRADELYAADAGVEDAIWKIQHGQVSLCPSDPPQSYTITDVNGKKVEYTIEYLDVGEGTYKITSIAVTDDGSGTAAISGTQIEAYITTDIVSGNYSGIMDHIITIAEDLTDKQIADLVNDEIEIGPGSNITPSEGEHSPVEYYPGDWPPMEELMEFYLGQVAGEPEYGSGTIDLDGSDMEIGPFYREGELDIKNSSNDEATLTLTGTVYITGDTLIGSTGKDFTLDLNGQTIFVESNSTGNGNEALIIGGQCTIKGPGAIIAVGDIYVAPKGSVGSDGEPVFIFSVSGTTYLQPSGDFYGSVAGSFDVEVKSGTTPTLTYPPGGFGDLNINFPSGGNPAEDQRFYSIASWEVSPI